MKFSFEVETQSYWNVSHDSWTMETTVVIIVNGLLGIGRIKQSDIL